MTKRAVCLILSLILPIVLLCGCSVDERLTKQEYADEISYRVRSFGDLIGELVGAVVEYETNGTPIDMENLTGLAENAKKSLKGIKSLSPPSEYEEYHSQLCDGVKSTLPYLNKLEKAFMADNMSEFDKACEEAGQEDKSSEFWNAWFDFVAAAVADDIVIDPNRLSADKSY